MTSCLSYNCLQFYVKHCFFQKLGSSGHRNATRCGLWWVEMLKATDQFKEAANVYFRISGEVIALFFLFLFLYDVISIFALNNTTL